STSTAATSRRSNSRLPTTLNARDQPPAEVSDQRVSGLTGAVQPIVYATLGTSGGRNLLQLVLNALAELPVTVIAATAGRSDLKTVPANAFVADYLPGEAAAARSAVVVCNGGSLTTQQALVAGVPVIGVAGNLDQHLNMEAVERAGAGVLLRTERLKSQRVAGAVMQVISRSEYRQAAARLADAFGRDRVGFPQHVENALRLMPENRPRTWLAS
ncbi:glycosyltransferase, partial [Mycobacterium tuberculosis]